MATYTPVRLFQVQLTTSEVTEYTVAGGTTVILKELVINNTTNVAVTVGISLVPTGGTASSANRIFGDLPVAANAVTVVDLSQVLNAGDFLSAKASVGAVVTVTCSGVTVV